MSNNVTADMTLLAAKLRRVREHLGLSRPPFANMLGIPMTTLKNYELGYRDSSADVFLIVANHPELKTYLPYLLDQSVSVEFLAGKENRRAA